MAPRLDAPTPVGMSPDTFLGLYSDLKAARRPMEAAVAVYRNVLGRMKKEGIDSFALSVLEKLVKAEEEQATLHVRNIVRYAGWTQSRIGLDQGDLFSASDDQNPSPDAMGMFAEAQAVDAGFLVGAAGERGDTSPHQAGTPLHAAWSAGWNLGQKKMVLASFGKKPKISEEPKSVTRRARGTAAALNGPETPAKPSAYGAARGNVLPIRSRGTRPDPKPAKAPAAEPGSGSDPAAAGATAF